MDGRKNVDYNSLYDAHFCNLSDLALIDTCVFSSCVLPWHCGALRHIIKYKLCKTLCVCVCVCVLAWTKGLHCVSRNKDSKWSQRKLIPHIALLAALQGSRKLPRHHDAQ